MSNKNSKNGADKMSKKSEEQQLYVNKADEKSENKTDSVTKNNKNTSKNRNSCK